MTSAGATGQSWLNNKHFLHPRVVVVVIVVVPRILSPYSDRRMARYTRHLTRAVARAILPSGRHGFMRGLFSGAVYLSAYLFWSPRRRDGHGASIPVDWLPERGSFDPCILWEGQGYFSCLPLIQRFPPPPPSVIWGRVLPAPCFSPSSLASLEPMVACCHFGQHVIRWGSSRHFSVLFGSSRHLFCLRWVLLPGVAPSRWSRMKSFSCRRMEEWTA